MVVSERLVDSMDIELVKECLMSIGFLGGGRHIGIIGKFKVGVGEVEGLVSGVGEVEELTFARLECLV